MKKIAVTKEEYFKLAVGRIEYLFRTKEWQKFMTALSACNPSDFEPIFGPSSFQYDSEYFIHNWVFEFKGIIFSVVTAHERGTTIETTHPKALHIIQEFVSSLLNDLKDNETVKTILAWKWK
jgi:hypothetical protein